jgi:hypothetical protein
LSFFLAISTQRKDFTMKLRAILSAGALAFTAFAINPVFAQMNMDHAKMGLAAAPGMTDGEVRKIDKDAGKITIKHGDIKHSSARRLPPFSCGRSGTRRGFRSLFLLAICGPLPASSCRDASHG